ncbi:TlpA family protein disulfide reductase [Flavobacterium amniphilum]|uniref:TlpA family protein disulfide reductase n=1 Tax=Flavobacterium amniphilum TaxID=1834035 RepID=UPI00202A1BFC|nr:TlpA disulfide reductase family protein [Flavobacterium amniphilum]MCL9806306.1 TlpA family protein disulfide reductase [Flavobacterium amniphilum]
MKKIIVILSLAVIAIASFAYTKAQGGEKVEEFSAEALASKLKDVNGKEISFQDIINKHKGKTIVIEAWASWCGDCIKNMPKLKELQISNPNAAFVFLSADKTSEAWLNGIKKHDLNGDHYLMDGGMKGNFGKSINLDWIPRYIIIDKKGKVALYRAIETDHEQVDMLLKKL